MQALYGIPTAKATVPSNTIGVSGFIQQFANNNDLQTFLRNLRPDLAGSTFSLLTLDGGQNPQGTNQAGIEAVCGVRIVLFRSELMSRTYRPSRTSIFSTPLV